LSIKDWQSKELPKASAISPLFTKAPEYIGSGLHIAFFDLTASKGQNFQKSQSFLGLFLAFNVLQNNLGLTVLGDNKRRFFLTHCSHNFRGVRL
jgi:hypothetical protein